MWNTFHFFLFFIIISKRYYYYFLLFLVYLFVYFCFLIAAVPEGYVELVHQCWAGNPKSRPSFNVVLMKLRHIKDQQSIYLSY